jgi:hypothetical protein
MARLQQRKQAAVTTGSAGSTGIPCAMVLTASFVLSPGTGLSCPRRKRDAKHHRQLDLSVGRPGPYDFAVRANHVRLTCHPRPSHPRPTCRDDRAYVPLHRGGMGDKIVPICPTRQARSHAADWHDGQLAHGAHTGIACRRRPNASAYRFITADHDPPYELAMSVDRVDRKWLVPGQNHVNDPSETFSALMRVLGSGTAGRSVQNSRHSTGGAVHASWIEAEQISICR